MDVLVSSALEEICAAGSAGLTLSALWTSLSSTAIPYLKASVWSNLVSIPSLQFSVPEGTAVLEAKEHNIGTLEDAERLNLKIIVKPRLWDTFVGLHDSPSSLSGPALHALDLITMAREHGITQNQLSRKLGKQGNDLFYIVRSLECRGLIVKLPVSMKSKEAGVGDGKGSSIVNTNLICLQRYAKHLAAQKVLETSKGACSKSFGNAEEIQVGEDDSMRKNVEENVLIRDYLPAMKIICNKLENATGKVLVVSDIKLDLGYIGRSGNRTWRHICCRLKDAHLVEEFKAQVNGKGEQCLRLLRRLFPKELESKTIDHAYDGGKQLMKFGKRFEQTDQLHELPIDRQIYDVIDAKEADGATFMEVCKKLGLDRKRNDSRLKSLTSRLGMHVQASNQNRTVAFRVWTPGNNSSLETPGSILSKCRPVEENMRSNVDVAKADLPERSTDKLLENDHPEPMCDLASSDKQNNVQVESQFFSGSPDHANAISGNKLEISHEGGVEMSDADRPPLVMNKNVLSQIRPVNYPYLPLTADGALREHRILTRLQEDKFIFKAELHRWLLSFETEKTTTVDRKTIDRMLNKLQREGQCICMNVFLPVVTNYGHSHSAILVLHPSIQSMSPELLTEIHERFRSFDKQVHGHGSKQSSNGDLPSLDGVSRSQHHVNSDETSVKLKPDSMHANGFVLAKMVRAKLMHGFLWDYLTSIPNWHDSFPSWKNVHTCRLFPLETATKALPIELFLQVVGSTQKINDMFEKCKMGLHLSDLSIEDHNNLMNARAINRLSLIIHILQCLKLIRFIGPHHFDEVNVAHAKFSHVIELKPYIEEPPSRAAMYNSAPLDLRPRIKHEFLLSTKEAVDEYWNTLEYCYAAADPRAALHAFPGSAVPEIFHRRSWVSLSVMSAYQRSKLLKLIGKDYCNKKFSYVDCSRIAKELKLTLQQVLRVYYGERRQKKSNGRNRSLKRKMPLEEGSVKNRRHDHLSTHELEFVEEQDSFSNGEHCNSLADWEHNQKIVQELESHKKNDSASFISRCANLKLPARRKSRFFWNDESDRQLIIKYVRHRATLGTKFYRICWAAIPDLPAPPGVCAKRMTYLNQSLIFRKPLMKLCTLVSEQYVKYLEKSQDISLNDLEEACLAWDSFTDKKISRALEVVLHCKKIAKREACKGITSSPKDFPNLPITVKEEGYHGKHKDFVLESWHHCFQQKLFKLEGKKNSVCRQVCKSLAISNAVELLKLSFLTSSTSPEHENLLEATLRRYSEHDLFVAFCYLKENNIMIGGEIVPFMLSPQFLLGICKSPFATNTGKRAARFLGWIIERMSDPAQGHVELDQDLQCGDIFALVALLSAGELSLSPSIPEEGVGEAEAIRSLKRKAKSGDESVDCEKRKRLRCLGDGDLDSRREKGFPGMAVSVTRVTFPVVDAVELFRDADSHSQVCTSSALLNLDGFVPTKGWSGETCWDEMASYAKNAKSYDPMGLAATTLFRPDVFKTVCSAIQRAGDQGLTMEEISLLMGDENGKELEHVVEVLQIFRLVLKVNSYDSVHYVDALYDSKYFLSSSCHLSKVPEEQLGSQSIDRLEFCNSASKEEDCDGHEVTILNLPEEDILTNKTHDANVPLMHSHSGLALSKGNDQGKTSTFSSEVHMPLLPWVNGDGSINVVVYNGLVRRVLGTVMQNPGILEDHIIGQIRVLNPQNCRSLLQLMILDGHLKVRTRHQSLPNGLPTFLRSLLGDPPTQSNLVLRKHFFANPNSSSFL